MPTTQTSPKSQTSHKKICDICHKTFASQDLFPIALLRHEVTDLIHKEHPKITEKSVICYEDLQHYRSQLVVEKLKNRAGSPDAHKAVIQSFRDQKFISRHLGAVTRQKYTIGEKLADIITTFGGSWKFIIIFGCFLAFWMGINSDTFKFWDFDPYPFILLNLVLSCLAAVQAPIILMSQNRQEARDRATAEHDYEVNLKAELEIQHLHEKVDHLAVKIWERFELLRDKDKKDNI